ncbi:hypothetical protein MRB53_005575 [Persea americana]|uniref:Uncharacterized protein n=1 Tax=Persea americana TaxID=3435 RepID=A0ACC2MDF2_PERAE|nr:hypothetical protein MRB53_005575 [Persea americana]
MAILVLIALMLLAMTGGSSANWCVCRSDVSDSNLQKTLDYACGAGADCNPIHLNGVCYNPNTVRSHCSYAVNSYFQKKGQAQGTCDFASTATVVTSDPSPGGTCTYPSSASTTGTSTTTTPNTATPFSPTTTGGTSPTTIGGISSGLGPTGLNTDLNGGFLPNADLVSLFLLMLFSGQVLFRG